MTNEVRMFVGANKLVINPKCKYLMACLEGGRWKDKRIRQEFAESKLLGHMDGLAALVYLIRNLDQGNSVPHLLGIGSNDHWINPEEEQRVNRNAQELMKMFGVRKS